MVICEGSGDVKRRISLDPSGSRKDKNAATWRKAFARLFKQVGIEGHIHQFRHAFAKRLLLSGTPMETVSHLLGHKKTDVTQRNYNKWILERQQNMEAVVRNSAHA
jgi:integrase